ncbi:MAG TPA: EutN/CcmL family microcompartment protein [Polyangia bacterium]|nr:EutN/CcmL family microcompartment protein [Polyangia bacterium]
MFLGRVTGSVWSTVKWPAAKGLKLLLVRPYRLADLPPTVAGAAATNEPLDDLVVCADLLDAGPGDDVLVAFGHAARVAVTGALGPGQRPEAPIDAAVVAIVDRVELEGERGARR